MAEPPARHAKDVMAYTTCLYLVLICGHHVTCTVHPCLLSDSHTTMACGHDAGRNGRAWLPHGPVLTHSISRK
jgi:hypothetical protein